MKGKNPTRKQKELIKKNKLNYDNCLALKTVDNKMSKFKKILFATNEEVLEVQIKGEFHQAACKHDFRKGKLIRGTSTQNILAAKRSKDTTLCIKCGKRKGKENGRKKVFKKTI